MREPSEYMKYKMGRKALVSLPLGGNTTVAFYAYKSTGGHVTLCIERDSPSFNHSYGETIVLNNNELKDLIAELSKLVDGTDE